MNFAANDEYAQANPVFEMIDQVLQNLVRDRTFNFQQVAADIKADFGVQMSAQEVRQRFARLEMGSPAGKGGGSATTSEEETDGETDEEASVENEGARSPFVAPQAPVHSLPVPSPAANEEKEEEKTQLDPQAAAGSSSAAPAAVEGDTVLSMPSTEYMEALLAGLSVEQQGMAESTADPSAPKSEMQQVLDILNAPEEEQAPATMESLFGISEAEFHEQVKEMERQHQEAQGRAEAVERAKKETPVPDYVTTTEESMKRSLDRTKVVFDRVVKALGIETDEAGDNETSAGEADK